ncbi:MAG: hypothetical protein V2I76_08710, partial [Roseobacter sp.]|nr:hypothetical protein [Roseobacter sp.]
MWRLICAALACLWLSQPTAARAHALDPGYLEILPLGGDEWRITWRKPQINGRQMAIDAVLPL